MEISLLFLNKNCFYCKKNIIKQICQLCYNVGYCSSFCQLNDWKNHSKSICFENQCIIYCIVDKEKKTIISWFTCYICFEKQINDLKSIHSNHFELEYFYFRIPKIFKNIKSLSLEYPTLETLNGTSITWDIIDFSKDNKTLKLND